MDNFFGTAVCFTWCIVLSVLFKLDGIAASFRFVPDLGLLGDGSSLCRRLFEPEIESEKTLI